MPKPRSLNPLEERAAFAKFQACMGARGAIAMLAREYRLTWVGMKGILDRQKARDGIKDSRESLKPEQAS